MNPPSTSGIARRAVMLFGSALALAAGASAATSAPTPLVTWATSAEGTLPTVAWGVSALADGSSIVAGEFAGTATFGGTTLTSSSSSTDLFTGKLNADGTWGWVTGAGGGSTDIAFAASALPDGSSIITGYFMGAVTFGTTTLTSAGNEDVFTAKLNANGTWAWAARAGGTRRDEAYGVSVLPDGSSIVTGRFRDSATFGGTTLTGTGAADAFTAKMNANGTWAWATRAGGTSTAEARSVSVLPDGSSIVAGYFDGTATFGGTTLTSSGGSTDVFTAKMNANGTWAWATGAGGTSTDKAWGATALADGSSIVTGGFDGTAVFGTTSLTSAGGSTDVFTAKMNANGTWAWATRAGGSATDEGRAVSSLPDGSSIVTGSFSGTGTFGATSVTSAGTEDVFSAGMAADGTWSWATSAGGTGTDQSWSVSALPDGSSTVAGEFAGTATFGGTTLTSGSFMDPFAARYLSAPQAPSAPTAAAGDKSATVSITPLAGGSVTSYKVTPSSAGTSCTIVPPATNCVVTGLAGGTSYTFTATATNAAGTSAASATSNVVIPGGAVPNPATATLAATVLPSRKQVLSGQQLRIGLRATNTGAATAQGVTSCVTLPSRMVLVRAVGAVRSGRNVCLALGTIAAGSQKTGVLTVRAVTARRTSVTIASTARATDVSSVRSAPVRVVVRPRAARTPVAG